MAFPESHNKEGVKSDLKSSSLNPGAPASVMRELDGTWKTFSKTCSLVELSSSKTGGGESAEVCWTALTVSPVTMSFMLSEAGFCLGGQKVQCLGVSPSQYWALLFPFAID